MKILILSDIHGNLQALKEVFNNVLDIDMIFFLGDYITDIPCSHEVIEFLKVKMAKYKSYIIRGNREDYIIHYDETKDKNWSLENNTANLLFTYNSLTKEDLDFIKNLKKEEEVNIYGYKILLTHKYIENNNYDIVLYGHTHLEEYKIIDNTRYLNPGSIGLPNGTNKMSYLILEIDEKNINAFFYRMEYNYLKVVETIKNSKLMNLKIRWGDVLIKDIKTGIPYTSYYVDKAKELAKDKDNITLDIWEEEYKKLNYF